MIPGNHDAYTRGSVRTRRFEAYLGELVRGEASGPCRTRDGDEFPELCSRINEVADLCADASEDIELLTGQGSDALTAQGKTNEIPLWSERAQPKS